MKVKIHIPENSQLDDRLKVIYKMLAKKIEQTFLKSVIIEIETEVYKDWEGEK